MQPTVIYQPPVARRLAVLRQLPPEEFGDVPTAALSHVRHVNRTHRRMRRLTRAGAR